jgi:hypothetical protein
MKTLFFALSLALTCNAQTIIGAHDIGCPAGQLAIPLAQPPATTGIKIVRLLCVPLDPAVFAIRNGLLTLATSPVIAYVYDAPLTGTLDGTNAVFSLPVASSQPASMIVWRNGIKLTQGTDYTLSGATVTFAAGAIPQPGDLMNATYIR